MHSNTIYFSLEFVLKIHNLSFILGLGIGYYIGNSLSTYLCANEQTQKGHGWKHIEMMGNRWEMHNNVLCTFNAPLLDVAISLVSRWWYNAFVLDIESATLFVFYCFLKHFSFRVAYEDVYYRLLKIDAHHGEVKEIMC